jgi:hypothetical protein
MFYAMKPRISMALKRSREFVLSQDGSTQTIIAVDLIDR